MRTFSAALAALSLVVWCTPAFAGRDLGPGQPGVFDYYVLSLTWVPTFCTTKPHDSECSKGLGFALHGLWPQFANGDYPTGCSDQALTADERQTYQDIYPSRTMIDHEWTKHGTCSGLSAANYFTLSDGDAKRVVVPDAYQNAQPLRAKAAKALKAAFLAANPTLSADDLSAVVANGRISEVRFCVTRDGAFRSCH